LLVSDGADGTALEMLKSDILGTDGATGIEDSVMSLGKSEDLEPILFCMAFKDAYSATKYSASSGNAAIAESPYATEGYCTSEYTAEPLLGAISSVLFLI
tara:strand:+ start:215 stop:514 length:300 start_codon:yes stop_codon:yes gene_type:complete